MDQRKLLKLLRIA